MSRAAARRRAPPPPPSAPRLHMFDTWLLIHDLKGDVEEPGPHLAAYLVSQQAPLADRHPPQGCYVHRTHAQGLCDVRDFPLPSGVPV